MLCAMAKREKTGEEDQIATATRTIIRSMGYAEDDPHLRDTPDRVARFMASWHTIGREPPTLTTFPVELVPSVDDPTKRVPAAGLVVTTGIVFYSLCAHHGLPFFGEATVGYIPNEKLVGLSKLARVVDFFAHRFQTQERMSEQVADYLNEHLSPVGVGVITRAEHLCMSMRGVTKPGHCTSYSALRGALFNQDKARAEFLALAGGFR